MKKLLCTILSVLFIVTMLAPGFCLAEDPSVEMPTNPTRYDLTTNIVASLSISGNTAHASGRVGAMYASAHCSITVKLQKKNTNGTWSSIKTWRNSGTGSTSAGGSCYVGSGSYRTCVTATVTYNGQSEHPYKYSGTYTC